MSSRDYGGIIWTNHALARLGERGLSQEKAWETYKSPDRHFPGKQSGTMEFQKRFGSSIVTLIAKQNERHEWLVLSCWIDPPLPGTEDFRKKQNYEKYRKSGFWGKVWYTIKQQLGL
jgi:hypothetical protein